MHSVVLAVIALFAAQKKKRKTFLDYEGKIDKVVDPRRRWRIYHRGIYWAAYSRSGVNFQPGDWVRVVDRDGIVLVIEPLEDGQHI